MHEDEKNIKINDEIFDIQNSKQNTKFRVSA